MFLLALRWACFIGKQVSIFTSCWLALKSNIASMPAGMNMARLYGIAALCVIGFTVGLFVGSLAFKNSVNQLFDERLGILLGSVLSGLASYISLNAHLEKSK